MLKRKTLGLLGGLAAQESWDVEVVGRDFVGDFANVFADLLNDGLLRFVGQRGGSGNCARSSSGCGGDGSFLASFPGAR